ncbi:MAG TPA: glucose-6-phosphate dehydrogenase [Gammaproteobacteria bacterium]|nr:glucose-6-phosphate dehydrogenase [Gammaproteobacteria bacterium]
MNVDRSDALVLFGATGDLAHRKIFPAVLALFERGYDVPLIGVAKSGMTRDDAAQRLKDSLEQFGDPQQLAARSRLLENFQYIDGDYRDAATFDALEKALAGRRRPLFYLAIPPSLFGTVVSALKKEGLADGGRVVVEKPFGRDLESAKALNAVLRGAFEESAVFRIDHYLGKESVQNLLLFRFANSFLEPIWNRNYVDCVSVTMAETIGVEGRGRFYEEVGAIRDVVQNHMLQVVTHVAMEPPVGRSNEALRDEKMRVLRSIRTVTGRSLVRGQYRGYTREPGVAPDSKVETYAAMQLHLDSWRWEGVPFFIRAGKRLAVAATEVLVRLKRPPRRVFAESGEGPGNYFRFRLGPERVSIAIGAQAKKFGKDQLGEAVELYFCNMDEDEMSAYERLIAAAMDGDPTLFAREDAVLEAWRILDPLFHTTTQVFPYEPGSWGPPEANRLERPGHRWPTPAATDQARLEAGSAASR